MDIDLPKKLTTNHIPILLRACKCEIAQDFIPYVGEGSLIRERRSIEN